MVTSEKITEAFVLAEDIGVRENGVQRQYADRVGEMIRCALGSEKKSGQGFIEGETGTGKTLGYLVPILLQIAESGQRAIISTYTLALQRQIMGKGGDMERALSIVERMTGKKLTAARRIGKRNFIDRARINGILATLEEADADTDEWEDFMAWCATTETGEIQEYLEDGNALPANVLPEDICLTGASVDDSLAHYKRHIETALAADVVVTNHAMLVRAGMHGIRLLHDGSREIDVLLIDEVDRIRGVAEDATSDQFSLVEAKRLAERWADGVEHACAFDLVRAISRFHKAMDEVYPEYKAKGKESVLMFSELAVGSRAALVDAFAEVARNAVLVNDIIGKSEGELEMALAEHLDVALRLYADMLEQDKASGILALRWSPHLKYPSVRRIHLYPLRILSRMWKVFSRGAKPAADGDTQEELDLGVPAEGDDESLRRRVKALVVTSATISAPREDGRPDFDEMKIDLSVYDKENPCAELHAGFSPARFGHASFVFPAPNAPLPFLPVEDDPDQENEEGVVGSVMNPDWVDYVAHMVKAAREDKPGRILVLCNSYNSTAAVSEAVRALGIDVIEKTRRVRPDACLDLVCQDENAVFISPSAWEGMDLQSRGVKNAWTHIIMSQIPYSAADGVREKALQRDLVARGKSLAAAKGYSFARVMREARRKARQGLGRGIRDSEDVVTFWIADPRFPTPQAFLSDVTGVVPGRTVRAHRDMMFIIPKRFRSGMTNRVEKESRMFLVSGKIISAAEILKAAA